MPVRRRSWCPGVLVALAGSGAALAAGPYANPTDLGTVPGLTPGVVFNGTATADRAGEVVESIGDGFAREELSKLAESSLGRECDALAAQLLKRDEGGPGEPATLSVLRGADLP